MIVRTAVRHNGSDDGETYSLRFSEQRHKKERCQDCALQENRNGQGTALDPAFAHALFGIAVHQAYIQRPKTIFRASFGNSSGGNTSGLGRHHTPPQFFPREFRALRSRETEPQKILRRRLPGGCSRSPGDRRRARRDVRLRASSLRWTPRVETSSRAFRRRAVSEAKQLGNASDFNCKLFVMNMLQIAVSGRHCNTSYCLWTWILGGKPRWTGTISKQ